MIGVKRILEALQRDADDPEPQSRNLITQSGGFSL